MRRVSLCYSIESGFVQAENGLPAPRACVRDQQPGGSGTSCVRDGVGEETDECPTPGRGRPTGNNGPRPPDSSQPRTVRVPLTAKVANTPTQNAKHAIGPREACNRRPRRLLTLLKRDESSPAPFIPGPELFLRAMSSS